MMNDGHRANSSNKILIFLKYPVIECRKQCNRIYVYHSIRVTMPCIFLLLQIFVVVFLHVTLDWHIVGRSYYKFNIRLISWAGKIKKRNHSRFPDAVTHLRIIHFPTNIFNRCIFDSYLIKLMLKILKALILMGHFIFHLLRVTNSPQLHFVFIFCMCFLVLLSYCNK